jgi:hypothetical protein
MFVRRFMESTNVKETHIVALNRIGLLSPPPEDRAGLPSVAHLAKEGERGGYWSLGFGTFLGFGIWDLVFSSLG